LDQKTIQSVRARLSDGFTVDDLCAAIDGMHRTPHNLGQNATGTRYLDLELCVRTAAHVRRFMDAAEAHAPARSKADEALDEALRRLDAKDIKATEVKREP
jgi:hypothetical protein